jgi:hypothetical protein
VLKKKKISKKEEKKHTEINRHNKPIDSTIPLKKRKSILFGKMKGTAHIKCNLTESIGAEWEACLFKDEDDVAAR